MPVLASDIFTCGLILYELLAGRHPYWSEDQADYARLVQGQAEPPALLGRMPWPASNADVSAALHRCLDPNPAGRPTASELRAILSGRNRKPASPPAATTAASPVPKRPPASPAPGAGTGTARPLLMSDAVELLAPGGGTLQVRSALNWASCLCVGLATRRSIGMSASACSSGARADNGR